MKIQPQETLVYPKASFITIGYEGFTIDISEATDCRLLAEVLKILLTVC
ncbi:hypothetical protein [Clostridium formicaceticum]|nr:hypothetical protein [Clostridium formicaceticum]